MKMEKRKAPRRTAVYTTLSEVEKEKAEKIADEMGGVSVAEALRRVIWDYQLKAPQN